MKRSWFVLLALVASALVSGLSACAASGGKARQEYTLAPESALPNFVRDAPPQVREAYRFAIANPDVLSAVPCYCGCAAMGHQSNLDCYVKQIQPDGSIEFENHAFG